MTADLLRRAAAKLREAAATASEGPWDAAEDGLVWPGRLGDPVSGSVAIEDAEYIALLHPPVALALATALDWAEGEWRTGCIAAPHTHPLWVRNLVDVARAALREEAS